MNGKWIYLGQRNPRLSRSQFAERWLKHRKMGAPPAMGAEFLSADYCAVLEETPELTGVSSEYDAVGLFALRDICAIPLVAGFLKQDYIQADERRFFNATSDSFSMFCAENILRDGPAGKTVLIQFLRRAADIGPSAFRRQWEAAHGARFGGAALPAVRRYIQNIMIAPPPPGFGYDGIAELWFDDVRSVAESAAALNAMMADAFIDPKTSFSVLTNVIIGRPRN
jgi:hypothetical protein